MGVALNSSPFREGIRALWEAGLADIDDLFAEMARRLNAHPDRLAGVEVIYQFNLEGPGGGTWHVRIENGKAVAGSGAVDNPPFDAHLSVADYTDLVTGAVSGQELFFSGRMKVDGNPFLGMQLTQLLAD
jgi:putative sterol carrier protein